MVVQQHEFIAALHGVFKPRTYLEVGVAGGQSLAQSRCRSIGVDPEYRVFAELRCDVQLVRAPSDDFFARPDATAHFGGRPADLVYIDGMHLLEFALRDFINSERVCSPTSVILIDDILPRSDDEAARDRHTGAWTGDVFKILPVLQEYRPDLVVVPVDNYPCGTAVVFGLDPDSTVLRDHYDEIVRRYVTPDPQHVPTSVLRRTLTVERRAVLGLSAWGALRRRRGWRARKGFSGQREPLESALPLASRVRPALRDMIPSTVAPESSTSVARD